MDRDSKNIKFALPTLKEDPRTFALSEKAAYVIPAINEITIKDDPIK